jgi:hypothetical protein
MINCLKGCIGGHGGAQGEESMRRRITVYGVMSVLSMMAALIAAPPAQAAPAADLGVTSISLVAGGAAVDVAVRVTCPEGDEGWWGVALVAPIIGGQSRYVVADGRVKECTGRPQTAVGRAVAPPDSSPFTTGPATQELSLSGCRLECYEFRGVGALPVRRHGGRPPATPNGPARIDITSITLVDGGAAVDVKALITCPVGQEAFATIQIAGRAAGDRIAYGVAGTRVDDCTGAPQAVTGQAVASSLGGAFAKGPSSQSVSMYGCRAECYDIKALSEVRIRK